MNTKRPIILKTVLDIFFVLLIIKIVLKMGMDSVRYFSGLPINYFGSAQEINKLAGDIVGLVVANICIQLLMVFFILKLKQLIGRYLKGEIFSTNQTKDLATSGKILLGIAALDLIPYALYLLFRDVMILSVGYQNGEFGSFWYVLVLGLFFIFLSNVFDNARILKEENQLTV